MRPK
jgi:hypothetical protein